MANPAQTTTEVCRIELVDRLWFVRSECPHIRMWTVTDAEEGIWQAIVNATCDHESMEVTK